MCQASPWEPTFLNLLSNQRGWGQAHPEPAADTGSGEGSPAPTGGAATQPQLEGDQPHTHLMHFNEGKRQLLHLGGTAAWKGTPQTDTGCVWRYTEHVSF